MSKEEQAAYRRYLDDRVILADQIFTAKGEGRLEGRAEGRAEGREEGREEGRAEVKIENARKMKELGSTIEFISQVTGLTVEEIEAL